ncbi:hypothetical protein [Nostoc sp.]|uniref:hypothetical protein n=1 Tax=Nostoc sp. TaxID=1180 RepID=UPI002FF6C28D
MANAQFTQVANINEIFNQVGVSPKLRISATQRTDASRIVKFSVSFDSGDFFSKLLKEQVNKFQSISKPAISILNFLNTEIPLMSDYPDVFKSLNQDFNSAISVLDVVATAYELKTMQQANIDLVSDILSLGKFVSNLPLGSRTVLEELTVDTSGIVGSQPSSFGISISQPAGLPKGFQIPLLTDPVDTVFGILTGQTKDIFSGIKVF